MFRKVFITRKSSNVAAAACLGLLGLPDTSLRKQSRGLPFCEELLDLEDVQTPPKLHCNFAVFSGGTACNHLCVHLHRYTDNISYILPVTDNGGSTAKIVQVIGGPAIGDIRSRLSRLSKIAAERHVKIKISGFTGKSAIANGEYIKQGNFEGSPKFVKLSKGLSIFYSQGFWYLSPHLGLSTAAWARKAAVGENEQRAGTWLSKVQYPSTKTLQIHVDTAAESLGVEGSWIVNTSSASGKPKACYPAHSLVTLLDHRLTDESPEAAESEYRHLVNGTHKLYEGIGEATKGSIRAFLAAFGTEVVKNTNHKDIVLVVDPAGSQVAKLGNSFDYSKASVGNCLFSGMRLTFGSLPTAIWMWHQLAHLPAGTHVFPSVNTNCTLTIGAELTNGKTIIGQNAISHPNLLDQNGKPMATKAAGDEPMDARIKDIFYVNAHWEKMAKPFPPYTSALEAVSDAEVIVYSMGSLYTSLVPSLILPGMGDAVKASERKILLLNAYNDRETKWYENGRGYPPSEYSMVDFVDVVCKALHQGHINLDALRHRDYVTDVICAQNSQIPEKQGNTSLEDLSIQVHYVEADADGFMQLEAVALKVMELSGVVKTNI